MLCVDGIAECTGRLKVAVATCKPTLAQDVDTVLNIGTGRIKSLQRPLRRGGLRVVLQLWGAPYIADRRLLPSQVAVRSMLYVAGSQNERVASRLP
jgi:hypothetical protein